MILNSGTKLLNFMIKTLSAFACAAAFSVASASAQIVLDFEGLADGQEVGTFYTISHGVTFDDPVGIALIDTDFGGTGKFAGNPSGETVFTLNDEAGATILIPLGFTDSISFEYSAPELLDVIVPLSLQLFDADDNSLGLFLIPTTGAEGPLNNEFSPFFAFSQPFTGIATRVVFNGTTKYIAIDDLTFGEGGGGGPGPGVPEPSTALFAALVMGSIAVRRKRS